ncbi:MAG: NERD domain-containing protein [Nanoarchaeota archaeon]|nr:NERD domain-containing protein [Nanoarchaeota archaeon]
MARVLSEIEHTAQMSGKRIEIKREDKPGNAKATKKTETKKEEITKPKTRIFSKIKNTLTNVIKAIIIYILIMAGFALVAIIFGFIGVFFLFIAVIIWLAARRSKRTYGYSGGRYRNNQSEENKQEIYKAGNIGEEKVASVLADLPKEFYVWNDIALKPTDFYANIDHLVIGPNGVFLIETKSFAGKVVCDENCNWKRTKTDRWGIEHEREGPSKAIWQINKYTYALHKTLNKHKMRVKVNSLVVSTTDPWDVRNDGMRAKTCHISKLRKTILNGQDKLSKQTIEKINKIIAKEKLER